MDKKEQEIQRVLEKLSEDQVDEVEEGLEHITKNIFENHVAPREALAISPQKIEGIYAQGYQLFNNGRYKKALKTFEMLNMLGGDDPRFYMAAGACHHKLKNYQKAIEYYSFAAAFDQANPIPLYHAFDCSMELNDPMSAATLLQMVIDRCGDKQEYAVVKDRATLMLKGIIKEVNENGLKMPEEASSEEKND